MNPENRAIKIHIKEMAHSKDRRLQNSDTIQGDINCPCEPQRGIRSIGLSCREVQHSHGILDLWKKTKRIAPDVP